MKRKILRVIQVFLWMALIISVCCLIIELFLFIRSKNRSQKPLPEFTYESETVINKTTGLNCDTYLFICSSHETYDKGFFPKSDFLAALNVKVTGGEVDAQVSSDTGIVHSSRESKQIPATRQEAWSVLSQSGIFNELGNFFSDAETDYYGDNATEWKQYVIAFFTFPSNTMPVSNKGIFFIYEKDSKDIVYLSTITLSEDYSFFTSSTSMTLKSFQILN